MKLIVNGRHLEKFARFDPKNIETQLNVHENSVTLRLDDKENLSWWIEVDLPKNVLLNLIKEMDEISNESKKETD